MSRRILRPLLSPVLRTSYSFLGRNLRGHISRLPGITPFYRRLMRPLLLPPEAEPGLVRVKFPDFSLYLDANDTGGEISLGKPWEPTTTLVFREMLRPGDAVIDVGANCGYFTVLAATLCGAAGKVFAFEPHPRTYAVLSKNILANGLKNVVAVQKAVSDRQSVATLYLASNSDQHSIIHEPPAWGSTRPSHRPIEVEVTTLDDFFSGRSIRPRLLKMDIEGAEPLALKGMNQLISKNPHMAVVLELNPHYLDSNAVSDLLSRLAAYGLRFIAIDDAVDDGLAAVSNEETLRRFMDLEWPHVLNLLCTRDENQITRLLETCS